MKEATARERGLSGPPLGEGEAAWQVERRKLLEQLAQSHKLEGLGILASSIAHDFNNVLTAILGYTEMARDAIEQESPRQYLGRVLEAAVRARDLVQQVLAYRDQLDDKQRTLEIHMMVRESLHLLRAFLPTNIRLHTDIADDCGFVKMHPYQVHQVLMNLCTNAYQAMPEGGDLHVTLQLVPAFPGGAEQCIELVVRDTGVGMSEHTRACIFEPFFTTRGKEDGTGIGLATVREIVEGSGGRIHVESEPHAGSTFRLLLPRVEPRIYFDDAPQLQVTGGAELVLYVDDERSVGHLVELMLQRLGYEALVAGGAEQALALLAERHGAIDLIVADQVMPGMSGMQLAHRVRALYPRVPFVLASGSAAEERGAPPFEGIIHHLHKPFVFQALANVVRTVLDENKHAKAQEAV